MEILKKEGWLCIRTARSRSPVDILAAKGGKIKLVQVKSGKGRLTDDEVKELQRWSKAFDARAEVWFFKRGSLVRRPIYVPRSCRS